MTDPLRRDLLAAVQDAGWARADHVRWRLLIDGREHSAHPSAEEAKTAAEAYWGEPLPWERRDDRTWLAWSHRE